MKSHKYWSLGALATMIGTFYTGYKDMKSAHKYFACSSLLMLRQYGLLSRHFCTQICSEKLLDGGV